MFSFPLLVILAPLIAALLSVLPKPYGSDRSYTISWWALVAGFAASLPVLWRALQTAEPTHIVLFTTPWNVLPTVACSIDRLAAIMLVVISSIGMLLYRYSRRYLQQDPGLARYMTLLTLCISALLLMVTSADLLTLFIAWQLLSWFLCLLAHNFAHVPTAQSSFRTFITLRAGDIAFLCGIVLAFHLYGTIQLPQLFHLAAADHTPLTLLNTGLHITGPTAVALLLLIGAMAKSAQFPLHMWLPDSLYAPTPIHALLHAGIINAGGFLLNRLAPLYSLSPITLHIVLLVGLCTLVFGKCMMLVTADIKRTLGYSTIGQMGYMMMECGLGAFSLAVFHLVAHGLFKATVFLNCGDVIHKARLYPQRPAKPASTMPGIGSWVIGFLVSLVFTMAMIIAIHYAFGISLLTPQAMLIFALFSWVTAAHATLTLFRLDLSWAKMSAMLALIAVAGVAYFLAAEHFIHFLYPDPAVVSGHFQAASLPYPVFLGLAVLLIASIVTSWFMLYLHYHDRTVTRRGEVWAKAYVFFLNRLYLDNLALRLFDSLKTAGRALDQSPIVFAIAAVFALGFAWTHTSAVPAHGMGTVVLLFLSALCLPLFPFHGFYVAALTRAPRALCIVFAFLLPALGLFLLPKIPFELLSAIGILSIFGAIWGTIKALVQVRVVQLLSYSGLALYSVFWWHVVKMHALTAHAVLFGWAVTLVIGGLVLAWDRIRVRHGDLELSNISGLYKPMPRFAVCMGLLIMAAVGLPPFGLFFGFLHILLSPSTHLSFGMVAMIAAWFAASWYMFKLMQRLFFGQHRADLHYEDLRPAEIAAFAIVIILLVIPISMPQHLLQAGSSEVTWKTGDVAWR